MEWFEIGESVVSALDAGASQREVAAKLGRSQAWVSCVARWWVREQGETRWYLRNVTHNRLARASVVTETHKRSRLQVDSAEGEA